MLPAPADCIHIIRRAVGNSDDSALATVPVGVLDVAAEDYADRPEAQVRWDELRAAGKRQAWIEDRPDDKEPSE